MVVEFLLSIWGFLAMHLYFKCLQCVSQYEWGECDWKIVANSEEKKYIKRYRKRMIAENWERKVCGRDYRNIGKT